MDKYEYKVRADEIKSLIDKGEYAKAADIADTIDWRRVKSVMMLCTISDLYKINRRYEDAKSMMLLAYDKRPGGRSICYSLCELCLKTDDFMEALNYYSEFVQVAPKDPGRYILKYKIYEAQDTNLEERISVLEELKSKEYREKWAYELAYLYHRVGLETKCVEECNQLILWFGSGKYVIKAMELKMLHQPLTPEEQAKYDARFQTDTQAEALYTDTNSAGETVYSQEEQPVQPLEYQNDDASVVQPEERITEKSTDLELAKTKTFDRKAIEEALQDTSGVNEDDVLVQTMDVGMYNTTNLQQVVASNMQELMQSEKPDDTNDQITRAILSPMLDTDTESLDLPQIDEILPEDLGPEPEKMESTEVFFSENEEQVRNRMQAEYEHQQKEAVEPAKEDEITIHSLKDIEKGGNLNVQPPRELRDILSQEADGQISLVIPDNTNMVEKQITGQINLQEYLASWNEQIEERKRRMQEDVEQLVKNHTGAMLTEFDAAVRDGVLERLEKENLADSDFSVEEHIAQVAENLSAKEATEQMYEEVPEEAAEQVYEEVPEEVSEADGCVTYEESGQSLEEAQEWGEVEEIEEIADPQEDLTAQEDYAAEPSEQSVEEQSVWEIDETEDDVDPYDEDESMETVREQEIESGETNQETVASETESQVQELAEQSAEKIHKEQMKARNLTVEERELFDPFIQTRAGRERLVKALDNISMAPYTGNVIVTGAPGMDVMGLAKNIIRNVQMTDSNFAGKAARISGQGMNDKDVAEVVEKLKNGALIIEKASGMTKSTVNSLYKVMQQEHFGIIVVLEDSRKAMKSFLRANEKFAAMFTARIHAEEMSNDMLADYGKKYAYEQEYAIDNLGMLALHTRIEERQTSDHTVSREEVKEIVDEAISRASKKNLRHFFAIIFAKRYDDEDMIILGEKDFS